MKIAAIALVPWDDQFVAIKSKYGIVMPGGKWESPETFRATALRELREETGLIAESSQFLYCGNDGTGYDCYTFICEVNDFTTILQGSKEGLVLKADWPQFFKSDFAGYYDILKELYEVFPRH